MALAKYGNKVDGILRNPPKELTPGEVVTQHVQQIEPEVPFLEKAGQLIQARLKSSLGRRSGAGKLIKVSVVWREMSLAYDIQVMFNEPNKIGLERVAYGDTRALEEEILRYSEDKEVWNAYMRYLEAELLASADRLAPGKHSMALIDLDQTYRRWKKAQEAVEEVAAIESIKQALA